MKQLLIIRGRPGAGKSTTAQAIQKKLKPQKVAIFTPDYFYWQVFPGESNQHLVNKVLNCASQEYLKEDYLVILEGILPKKENGELFDWLRDFCDKNNISFNSVFLELPLEKAIERNRKRRKGSEISDEDIKTWYNNTNPKEIKREYVLKTENKTEDQLVSNILNTILE